MSSSSSRGSAERSESRSGSEEEIKSSNSGNSSRSDGSNSSSKNTSNGSNHKSKSSHSFEENQIFNQTKKTKSLQYSNENTEQIHQNNFIKDNDQDMEEDKQTYVKKLISSILVHLF